jgi:hypothetical protein
MLFLFRSFFIISILVPVLLNGQGLDDALRYSRQQTHGTARFNSMAGAFNALGGDIGANHLNPASIGVFKKSEMSITLGLSDRIALSEYYETKERGEQARLNLNNMGIVFARELDHPGWKMLNISLSYTRKNDFNELLRYSGNQNQHNFTDYLATSAQGVSPSQLSSGFYQFVEYPAYQAYVIDPIDTTNWVYAGAIAPGENVNQKGDLIRRGRMSETMIGIGANHSDRFYIGGGVHITSINFTEEIRFREEPENVSDLVRYRYSNFLEARGTGFSFSGGVIIRLTDLIRWGASIQSPNYFVNDEAFRTSTNAEFQDGFNPSFATPEAYYRYNINTPLRLNSGLAVVLGHNGLISAEYEYQDFRTTKFKENRLAGNGYDFAFENDEIQLAFRQTHSIRSGIEYRINPVSIRAGYAFYQNPVKKSFSGVDRNIHLISAGIGTRYKSWLFDLGYQYNFQDTQYRQYQYFGDGNPVVQPASFALSQHNISVSATLRF